MSHESTLFLLGILAILAPFLGLPYSWLMVIVPALGLAIAALSVILRARSMQQAPSRAEPVASIPLDENNEAIV